MRISEAISGNWSVKLTNLLAGFCVFNRGQIDAKIGRMSQYDTSFREDNQ